MHEYSVIQAVLARVETEARAHNAHGVRAIAVSVGALSGVDPGLLETAYGLCRGEGLCADATLEICFIPALWQCRECHTAVAPSGTLRCQSCATPAQLVSGDELLLERIDMEVR
jgi:hydrogenase nickel incorporation protein HypA/HybF